jgi:hypothetical protein
MKMVFNIYSLIFSHLTQMKPFYAKLYFFFGIFGNPVMILACKGKNGLPFRFTRQLQHIYKLRLSAAVSHKYHPPNEFYSASLNNFIL